MFEDFDYKKALGGGGKLVKGVVKAVSPDAGPGVDEAGGGLGDILKAAGVELTDDEAAEQAEQKPQPPKKSNARSFDEFGYRPPREVLVTKGEDGKATRIESDAPEGTPWNDREITANLLSSRGWSREEIDRILAGPSGEPARREQAKAVRVKESDAATDDRTAVVNAAQPAKRVQTAKAQRIKK